MHFLANVILTTFLLSFVRALLGADELGRLQEDTLQESINDRSADASDTRQPRYLTAKTSRFAVDGSGLPEVDFDIGESYAGLLPVSGAANENRQLYFWFFPSSDPCPPKDVTIWLNGGPGCSSLMGLLQENGPMLWQPGTYKPVKNPYAWTNLTNMLYVEQPVGTGFTQGLSDITNEYELAQQFAGFFQQFIETFDLEQYGVYIAGESYAGRYIPYIANEMIELKASLPPLRGVSIMDPVIGDETLQQYAIVQPFVDYWKDLLALNQTFLQFVAQKHEDCGYKTYLEEYLQFPPPQKSFPYLPDVGDKADPCDLLRYVNIAMFEVNPCFHAYYIPYQCPLPWDALDGRPENMRGPHDPKAYFKREDVQRAINAPIGTDWKVCIPNNESVFGGHNHNASGLDTSRGPAENSVLTRIIEHTDNVIIGSGNLDFVVPTNGTLLALQNVTWHGKQGLQEYPGKDFYVPHIEGGHGSSGIVGKWGEERGVTFYQVQLAGHELPQYSPGAAFRQLELLLGKVESLGDRSEFTTKGGGKKLCERKEETL